MTTTKLFRENSNATISRLTCISLDQQYPTLERKSIFRQSPELLLQIPLQLCFDFPMKIRSARIEKAADSYPRQSHQRLRF